MAQKEYKELHYRDVGLDCDFLVRAETEDEAISIASEHACRAHNRCKITPEMRRDMKAAARSVWCDGECSYVWKKELQSPPGEWMED